MPVHRKRFSLCPIERTLAVLSGRWKAAVILKLFSGGKRYSDLLCLAAGVSERVPTQVLRELTEDVFDIEGRSGKEYRVFACKKKVQTLKEQHQTGKLKFSCSLGQTFQENGISIGSISAGRKR